MRKEYASEARNRLHNLYQHLTIQGFVKKQPETLQAAQWVISCAKSFDAVMGIDTKNAWEQYKKAGFNNEEGYQNFMEWVYKLDADLDTYFRSEWQKTTTPSGETYINEDIQKGFQAKKDQFNYQKLISLIEELNFNYSQDKVYASCALLRAILDHIPPLLGEENFKTLVSQHNWGSEKTAQRKVIKDLFKFRNTFDDALHRPVSNKSDIIDMSYMPNKFAVNTLLMECLESDTKSIKLAVTKTQSKKKQVKKPQIPDHYPAVSVAITQSGGKPYCVRLSFTNTGDKPAILEDLSIGGDIRVELNTQNMLPANSEPRQFGNISLEGSDVYSGSNKHPKLSIRYRDMVGVKYMTTYNILTKQRADNFFNVEGLSDLNIEVLG